MSEETNHSVSYVRGNGYVEQVQGLTYSRANMLFSRLTEDDGVNFAQWIVYGNEQYVVVNAFAALERLGIEP